MLSPNFTTSWLHFQEKFSETVKFHFNHFILLDKIQSDKAKAHIFWLRSYKGDGRSVLNAKNYPKGLSLKPPILLMQFHENSSIFILSFCLFVSTPTSTRAVSQFLRCLSFCLKWQWKSASKDWYWSAIPFCAFFNHINSKYRIRKDG